MIKIVILGAIQGLTEFFPVSSSGHLVIAQHFLGITGNVVFLDVLLHIGTILAIFVFFFKDILRALKNPKMIGLIAIVTLITDVIGITFKNVLEPLFHSAHATAIQILINGVILLMIPFFKERQRQPGLMDSAIMGVAQGVAIIPGISRSGLTIASLLATGIKREEAFRFSFIASIPAIIGAFLLEAKDANLAASFSTAALLTGVATSFAFGMLALGWLKKLINSKKFYLFGYYCIAFGIVFLFFLNT
jgi:undecaprenyl-diphosphatase